MINIKKLLKNLLIFLSIAIVGIYVFLVVFARQIETSSTFPFANNQKITWTKPIYLTLKDGKKISGVYLDQKSDKIIFYFHGNGQNLETCKDDLKYLTENFDANVIAYDYPGYGESEGYAYYDNVFQSSELFYDYIIGDLGIKKENILLRGYSIGGAVAIDLASKKEIGKLIITSSFTSRYDMSNKLFGFPIQKILFLPNSFVSIQKIQDIKIPTLIMHGNADKLIPFDMGKALFKNSGSNKKYFIEMKDQGHNNIFDKKGKSLAPIVNDFLKSDLNQNLFEI